MNRQLKVALGARGVTLSKKHPLHDASIFHDAVYETRKGLGLNDPEYQKLTNKQLTLVHQFAKEETSKSADLEFFNIMMSIIESNYSKKVFKRLYYKSLARIFYRITRIYGDTVGW